MDSPLGIRIIPILSCFPWVILLMIAGCSSVEPTVEASPTASLRPLKTAHPTATPGRPKDTVAPELTPEPTPTPLTHIVQEGETLLDIAYRYGIELSELLVANPGINPRFLSIGQALLVPGPEGEIIGALAPTTTPHPVQLSPTSCYSIPSGAVACLASASHSRPGVIEGLALAMTLLGSDFQPLRSEVVYSPLNLIRADQRMPVGALFEPPVPEFTQVDLSLLSSVYREDAGDRYLPAEIALVTSQGAEDGLSWTVSGRIELDQEHESALRLVLLGTALTSAGDPAGFNTWERIVQTDEAAPWAFELNVFSLGPAIERVELAIEALAIPD